MATKITAAGITPIVSRQRQHVALPSAAWLSAACIRVTSSVVQPSLRFDEGRYRAVPVVVRQFMDMAMIDGQSMTAVGSTTRTSITTSKSIDNQAIDFGGHRGSDATDGMFSIRSGFRSCSPPM